MSLTYGADAASSPEPGEGRKEACPTTDRQRYTCLEPGRRYGCDSVDSDFTREIEVDDPAWW